MRPPSRTPSPAPGTRRSSPHPPHSAHVSSRLLQPTAASLLKSKGVGNPNRNLSNTMAPRRRDFSTRSVDDGSPVPKVSSNVVMPTATPVDAPSSDGVHGLSNPNPQESVPDARESNPVDALPPVNALVVSAPPHAKEAHANPILLVKGPSSDQPAATSQLPNVASRQTDKGKSVMEDKQLPPTQHTQRTEDPKKNSTPKAAKSYASAATAAPRAPDVFAAGYTAIRPVKQGNLVSITVPDVIFQEQLNSFRFSLIGRMMHKKGDKPLSPISLKADLDRTVNPCGDWSLISLGRGFFTLKLTCEEDLRRLSKFSSIRCAVGVMYLREWTPDFDPSKEFTSVAALWVKAYHLPTIYWHPEVLTGLLSAAGSVVKLDGNTMSGAYGQFARALVEVDLAQPLVESVMVGCGSNSFFVDLVYENLPDFCPLCKFIGHSLDRCHKNVASSGIPEVDQVIPPAAPAHASRAKEGEKEQEWIVKRDRRHKNVSRRREEVAPSQGNFTHNSFEPLEKEREDDVEASVNPFDVFDKVTVPVNDYDKAVKACSPEVQQELSNIEQQLKRLEGKMQAEKLAKDLVAQ